MNVILLKEHGLVADNAKPGTRLTTADYNALTAPLRAGITMPSGCERPLAQLSPYRSTDLVKHIEPACRPQIPEVDSPLLEAGGIYWD